MRAVDVSEPTRPLDSEPEPEPEPTSEPSRLARRHQRLRMLFWLLVAAALLAGFGLGVAWGRGEARKLTQVAPSVPPACVEAVRQAEAVTRKGIRVQQTASRYLSVAGRYEAGILDGHQTLQQVTALGNRTRADAAEFLGALPAWQIARNHCQPMK